MGSLRSPRSASNTHANESSFRYTIYHNPWIVGHGGVRLHSIECSNHGTLRREITVIVQRLRGSSGRCIVSRSWKD